MIRKYLGLGTEAKIGQVFAQALTSEFDEKAGIVRAKPLAAAMAMGNAVDPYSTEAVHGIKVTGYATPTADAMAAAIAPNAYANGPDKATEALVGKPAEARSYIGATAMAGARSLKTATANYSKAQAAMQLAIEAERQALKIMDASAQAVQMLAGDAALTEDEQAAIREAFKLYDSVREVPAPGAIANPFNQPAPISEAEMAEQREIAETVLNTPSKARKAKRATNLETLAQAKQARRDLLAAGDPDGE